MTRATMQMVADEAGVSIATVSRALRGHPLVAAATQEKVHRIARQLHYRPNPLVSALIAERRRPRASGGATALAYITSNPLQEEKKQAVNYWQFYIGARDRAEEQGYRLEEFCLREAGMSGARISGIMRARGMFGALIAPVQDGMESLDIDCDSLAAAAIGLSLSKPALHRSSPHYYQSMGLAVQELTARGYRRIGFAPRDEVDRRFDQQWTARFLAYQQEIPEQQRVPVLPIQRADPQFFLHWIEKHGPDVIISSDIRELGDLEQAGYSVPDDIGYMHLGTVPRYGNVAGIDQNAALVGSAAVDLASGQLYRNEFGLPENPKIVLIEGKWKEGRTLRPKKSAS